MLIGGAPVNSGVRCVEAQVWQLAGQMRNGASRLKDVVHRPDLDADSYN
jgi:hypothetical protein